MQSPACPVVTEHRRVPDLHGTPLPEVDRLYKRDDAIDVRERRRGLEEVEVDVAIGGRNRSWNRSRTGSDLSEGNPLSHPFCQTALQNFSIFNNTTG